MRRTTAWIVALLLAAMLPVSSAMAQSSDVIRVGLAPLDAVTPLVYAVKAGIFKRYGVDVELVKLTSGAEIAAAISGGSLELGQGSPVVLSLAISHGLPFTVVGALSYYDAAKPDTATLVLANSPIRTAKDLEGKTLTAVSLVDINTIALFAWLDANGADRSTLKFVEIPPSAALAALEQGRVDATTLYEPFFSAAMASGKVRVLSYPFSSLAKHWPNSLLFGTKTWVSAHSEAVAKFLRASQEASSYIAAHESESPALIAQFTGVDLASIAAIRHPGRGVVVTVGDIQPVIDAAAKYNAIPKTIPASEMICSCALKR